MIHGIADEGIPPGVWLLQGFWSAQQAIHRELGCPHLKHRQPLFQ